MRSLLVLVAAGLIAAALYFAVAATWEQLAYCKADVVALMRHGLDLSSKPISVRLGSGDLHRVNAVALVAYFDGLPGWRAGLCLLMLVSLLCGGIAACTV